MQILQKHVGQIINFPRGRDGNTLLKKLDGQPTLRPVETVDLARLQPAKSR
jgi:hypothetical protein